MNELFATLADSLPVVAVAFGVGVISILAVAWLCAAVWVWRDARSRCSGPVQRVALLAPVLAAGVAGLPIYLALRPLRHAQDVRAASAYLEVLLGRVEDHGRSCACGMRTKREWVYCPACVASLQGNCGGCGALAPKHWAACAHCGADLDGPTTRPNLLPSPAAHAVRSGGSGLSPAQRGQRAAAPVASELKA